MMSLGIGWNTARRREWGSSGHMGVTSGEGEGAQGGVCFLKFDTEVTRTWQAARGKGEKNGVRGIAQGLGMGVC